MKWEKLKRKFCYVKHKKIQKQMIMREIEAQDQKN